MRGIQPIKDNKSTKDIPSINQPQFSRLFWFPLEHVWMCQHSMLVVLEAKTIKMVWTQAWTLILAHTSNNQTWRWILTQYEQPVRWIILLWSNTLNTFHVILCSCQCYFIRKMMTFGWDLWSKQYNDIIDMIKLFKLNFSFFLQNGFEILLQQIK